MDINVYGFGSTVYIKINEKLNNARIQVFNLEGREIYSEKLKNQFTEIKLNSPKGIYLVEILADDGIFTKKIYLN